MAASAPTTLPRVNAVLNGEPLQRRSQHFDAETLSKAVGTAVSDKRKSVTYAPSVNLSPELNTGSAANNSSFIRAAGAKSMPASPDVIASLNYPPTLPFVDNTFLSPYYASPLLPIHRPDNTTIPGADLVLHSLTKYINGHSDVLLGCVVLPPFSPLLSKLTFLQNAHGARGAKTLQLCMQAAGTSALALARATLQAHPAVESKLPGVGEDGAGDFPYSGIVSVRLRNEAQALKFLEELRIFTLAESLGGVESLAEHPATMTHSTIPEAEREERGITGGLVRMSVGVGRTSASEHDKELAGHLQGLSMAGERGSPGAVPVTASILTRGPSRYGDDEGERYASTYNAGMMLDDGRAA
ncbi:Cys/Met metabolism PLP-dependent enzyme-domain-containing protein [Mycena vitilis]|nr:Cys/Met metabolism PLP-dependent enzyme-domain-containing protein [Mycena vitilis]